MQPVKRKQDSVPDVTMQLPPVARKLNAMLDDGQFAAAEIGRLLISDKSLCSHLLRIAGSAMYVDDVEIETIEQMVNYIGVIQVRELVLLLVFVPRLRQLVNNNNAIKQCWQQYVYTGLLAYHLARQTRQVHPHTVYTGCLLYGIAELLVSGATQRGAAEPKTTLVHIINQWELPAILHECVISQKQATGRYDFAEAVAHVYIANGLAALPANATANRQVLVNIPDEYWQVLDIDDSRLGGCLKQARQMLAGTLALLAGE